MKKLIAIFAAITSLGGPVLAQDSAGSVEARSPSMDRPAFRITPAAGVASFGVDETPDADNFDDGFAAGLLFGFGSGRVTLDTGLMSLQNESIETIDERGADIDTLGVPLLARWNFSGNPNSTVYLKAGAMPFWDPGALDDFEDIDVFGVAGLGGALPLSRNLSILVDASYNRMFTDNGDLSDFSGYTLMAGLQVGI